MVDDRAQEYSDREAKRSGYHQHGIALSCAFQDLCRNADALLTEIGVASRFMRAATLVRLIRLIQEAAREELSNRRRAQAPTAP